MRHTTSLCCILFRMSAKLHVASVPHRVSQPINSPNSFETFSKRRVMRNEKIINLRNYIWTNKTNNLIILFLCQSVQTSLKSCVRITEGTVTTKETLEV